MVTIIQNLPDGLQFGHLERTESNELPEVRVELPEIVIPVLVTQETRHDWETDEDKTVYRYFEVRTKFSGGDIDDYAAILTQYYKPIRQYFYGSPEVQADLEYDHLKTAHILAVKDTFRKPGQTEPPEGIARWNAIKKEFWDTIDYVLASKNKDRSVLPAYFNDAYMLEWAAQNEVSAEVIAQAKDALYRVSSNLGANARNWSELFRD